MKRGGWCALILVIMSMSAWGQQAPQQEQEQQQQQEQRPTLGPAPAPSLRGPHTSTTTDPRKLRRIRTLYVESIDNSLSDRLIEKLAKMGRFRLVTKPTEADATLRGSCLESRRLKRVHSEIFISDRAGASIWQDSVFRPYNPPALAKAVDETAQVVLDHLGESIQEAEAK